MAETLSECPGMVRPPLERIVIASPSVEGRGNLFPLDRIVIASPSPFVILSLFHIVILSEAKNPYSAQARPERSRRGELRAATSSPLTPRHCGEPKP